MSPQVRAMPGGDLNQEPRLVENIYEMLPVYLLNQGLQFAACKQ